MLARPDAGRVAAGRAVRREMGQTMSDDENYTADGDLRYHRPDENGVEVAWEGADRWLVGTWAHDAVSGTIRDLMTRIADRVVHGDEDWAPLKVYLLGEGGTLHKCSVHTHLVDGRREVHIMRAGGGGLDSVASARFKVSHREG
ncbi:hypothetical protein E1091_00260 [Micromonospora fluostatini]|uniref:Uncharacterized protein n=1 Tax=Micromonospora fluostatini TaxID=1629071 RepID=A0ABY2DM97_9ACTN|nr:hypothetical protein E1091_00260 [Micromonospora fluostatini]